MDEAWLNTVRIARDCGNVSSLFPEGITRVHNLPYTLHNAIVLALQFLQYEELPMKERPPKKIWLNADKMKVWWSEVKRSRESEAHGEGSTMDMPQNELMKDMFPGLAMPDGGV